MAISGLSITTMTIRFSMGNWSSFAPLSYEGTDVVSLRTAFEEAVDDYLEFCKETGKQPEKPFKGSFNLRLDPELHKRLVSNAMSEGKTLNTFVKDLLQQAVSETHA